MNENNKELPGIDMEPDGKKTRWFTSDSCVVRSGDFSEVFVGGMLVGRFGPKEKWARNILMIGLSEDSSIKRGKLAWAFGISAERLRQLRTIAEEQGIEALTGHRPGGSKPKVSGKKKV